MLSKPRQLSISSIYLDFYVIIVVAIVLPRRGAQTEFEQAENLIKTGRRGRVKNDHVIIILPPVQHNSHDQTLPFSLFFFFHSLSLSLPLFFFCYWHSLQFLKHPIMPQLERRPCSVQFSNDAVAVGASNGSMT